MSKELTQAVAGKRIAWLMAILVAVAMLASVAQSARRANAASPPIVSITPTSNVTGVATTYTFWWTNSTLSNLTTATVVFPAAYAGLIPLNPTVTVVGDAACAGVSAVTAATTVTITIAVPCPTTNGFNDKLTIAGITNPAVGTYLGTSFFLGTNLDTPPGPGTTPADDVNIVAPASTVAQTLSKTPPTLSVASGGTASQTILWTNTSNQTVTNVTITDNVPSGETITAVVVGGTSTLNYACTTPVVGLAILTCVSNSGAALAGQTSTLALAETITAPAGTTLTDTANATASFPLPSPVIAAATAFTAAITTVAPIGGSTTTQSLVKSPLTQTVGAAYDGAVLTTNGGTATQYITWTNTSNQTIGPGALIINDVIPLGENITAAVVTGTATGATNANVFCAPVFNTGTLTGPGTLVCAAAGGGFSAGPGTTVIITLSVTIPAQAAGTLTDWASCTTVFPVVPVGVVNPVGCTTTSAAIYVAPAALPEFAVFNVTQNPLGPASVAPGSVVTYTINATTNWISNDLIVQGTLAPGLTFSTVPGFAVFAPAQYNDPNFCTTSGQTFTCALGDNPGPITPIVVTATINATTTQLVSAFTLRDGEGNPVAVYTTVAGTGNPLGPGFPTLVMPTTLFGTLTIGTATSSIAKTTNMVVPAAGIQNMPAVQTINWTNTSNQTVTNPQLTINDVIPAGETIVAVVASGTSSLTYACNTPVVGPGTLVCQSNYGLALAGQTSILALTETIAASVGTTLTDTASASVFFPVCSNNIGLACGSTPAAGTSLSSPTTSPASIQVGLSAPLVPAASLTIVAPDVQVLGTSTITVTAKDINGLLVANGTSVTLSVTCGNLEDPLFGTTVGEVQTTGTTSGVGTFFYLAPSSPCLVNVSAVSGLLVKTATFNVGLVPALAPTQQTILPGGLVCFNFDGGTTTLANFFSGTTLFASGVDGVNIQQPNGSYLSAFRLSLATATATKIVPGDRLCVGGTVGAKVFS